MYENLRGKTLLVMDRTALAACAVKRAKELGIKTVVANFYPIEDSPSKQAADVAIDVDISDIDAMSEIIKKYNIDGVFVGWTDSHLPFYADICERNNLPCCGTKEQFEILSNDKSKFKKECHKYGVPTPKEYNVDINFDRKVMDMIEYPVMVKPADGSGGRGIMKCSNEKELKDHFKKLYNASRSKKIVCEQYIDSDNEIFIHYTVQNGIPSLSAAFLKFKSIAEEKKAASCVFHMFAPSFMKLYEQQAKEEVENMIRGLGVQNGIIMFQGFENNGNFFFHESGLRMGGEQFYVFTEKLNKISSLNMMIEFAITGKMLSCNATELDNYHYSKYCCNYYIPLKAGKIARIDGIDKVNAMPQVLQNIQFKFVGDVISDTSSLDRVCLRIHVMEDTKKAFADALCRISNTLVIEDTAGIDMQLEKLTYDRVMSIINKTWQ